MEQGAHFAKNLECGLTEIRIVAHEDLSTAYINDVNGFVVFVRQLFGNERTGNAFLGISKNVLVKLLWREK